MNKKTFTTKRKAFSLIELSIVLIIIGLLVAGVTGGASLIKNAELRGVASEARGYQTAVNSFYAKYSGLPGDFPTAIGASTTSPSTVIVGNNDGLISFVAGIAGVDAVGRLESNTAWLMLKNDNFVNDSFTPGATDLAGSTPFTVALTGGTNVPASKSRNGAWTFDNITVGSTTQNVVILFGGSSNPLATTAPVTGTAYNMTTVAADNAALTAATSASATGNAQLLATDALSIDSKVDDGLANSGKVSALLNTSNNCSNAAVYTTATAYKACALAFQVDPNS
ncbi:MAG: prepilin-type N-terminal cleavage/methylation domain-containing protein [Pseudomonadota bacterium]